ncbi:MAG: non-heme iron oxygenase ferredoxin subunit, partial [Gemmatimonadetes bacterium]|nr:non-heme iron oxygenase ferredoxin subunit [Gemmatimonadota bacterium]
MSAPERSPAAGIGDPAGAEGWFPVGHVQEVPPGAVRAAQAGAVALALCNVEGEILAVEDNCSHQNFPLSTGELDDGVLTCDWHGAQFDIRSGAALALPAVEPVRTFPVRIVGGE